MYTGLRLSTQTFRADEQEYDHLPVAIEEINDTIGAPNILSVDSFSSIKDMYEYCARRGIHLVAPYKGTRGKPEREDIRLDEVDEHKIPRCPHCGGEGDILGPGLGHYWDENEEPRIRARCIQQGSDECRAHPIFSIACETEWRLLSGLPLTTQLYNAVAERHETFEMSFDADRDRHRLAGKDKSSILPRRGVPAQRLRAEIARLLDWFRASLWNGWIEGRHRVNQKEPVDLMGPHVNRHRQAKPGLGLNRLARIMGARRRRNLNFPYGPAAERLGLVPPRPAPPPEGGSGGDPPPDADAPADRG